ncbi:30020_t:CDS:2, partial [Racocetra persica]
KKNNDGELQYDHDVQEFENLPFKIKIETIDGEDNCVRLVFLNDQDKEDIVPDEAEREKREKKENKRLNDAINSITGLDLNDSEYDDEDSDNNMDIKNE